MVPGPQGPILAYRGQEEAILTPLRIQSQCMGAGKGSAKPPGSNSGTQMGLRHLSDPQDQEVEHHCFRQACPYALT